jgi:hypothetical protein
MICSPEGPDEVRIRDAAKDRIKQKWGNSVVRKDSHAKYASKWTQHAHASQDNPFFSMK